MRACRAGGNISGRVKTPSGAKPNRLAMTQLASPAGLSGNGTSGGVTVHARTRLSGWLQLSFDKFKAKNQGKAPKFPYLHHKDFAWGRPTFSASISPPQTLARFPCPVAHASPSPASPGTSSSAATTARSVSMPKTTSSSTCITSRNSPSASAVPSMHTC